MSSKMMTHTDMKKSEEIRQEANQEESDFKYMKKLNDAMRQERLENFEENWLRAFQKSDNIQDVTEVPSSVKWVITTKNYGILDFYPKANKVLVRRDNKWKKPGLKWLVNTFIKK